MKSLLTRFTCVLFAAGLVLAAGCQSAPPPNTLAVHKSEKWEKEIAALEAKAKEHPLAKDPIIFIGSSSIKKWTNLAKDFPNFPVVDHGFGGSQLADSVNFTDRLLTPFHPRQVVIYAGGNDINAGKNPDLVFGDFVALVTKIRAAVPQARLAYISSAPNPARWTQVEKVKRLNSLAAAYCRAHGIEFINVFPLMLGADGMPKRDIYVADRLHMNENGYAIWRAAVGPYLH